MPTGSNRIVFGPRWDVGSRPATCRFALIKFSSVPVARNVPRPRRIPSLDVWAAPCPSIVSQSPWRVLVAPVHKCRAPWSGLPRARSPVHLSWRGHRGRSLIGQVPVKVCRSRHLRVSRSGPCIHAPPPLGVVHGYPRSTVARSLDAIGARISHFLGLSTASRDPAGWGAISWSAFGLLVAFGSESCGFRAIEVSGAFPARFRFFPRLTPRPIPLPCLLEPGLP